MPSVGSCGGAGARPRALGQPAMRAASHLPAAPEGSRSLAAEEPGPGRGWVSLQVRGQTGRPVTQNRLLAFVMSEGRNPLSAN